VAEDSEMKTIFDRPLGLRLIGLTQMTFGFLGLVAGAILIAAVIMGVGGPAVASLGLVYATALFVGVAIPGLVIGNFVDDLRSWAVKAQIVYSAIAALLCALFLAIWGIDYGWGFPWIEGDIAVGRLGVFVLVAEGLFAGYLLVNWRKVVPPPGALIERDRGRARQIVAGLQPTPMLPSMYGPDGESTLSPDEMQRILEVRRVTTEEGMAMLCSNCGGANPVTEIAEDNTLVCGYCGVRLAVGSVFVPCQDHPEYLAATSCSVCGKHYCRRCLTAQEPPVDERWEGSSVHLCRTCFEGRYRPAVTTTSLVIPIDQLFSKAGSRFSRIGGIYRSFLGKYAKVMRYVLEFALRIAGSIMKGGGKAGGGSSDDGAAMFLIALVIIVVAIPLAAFVILLLGAIVIIPLLFYAGLIGVTIEAVKIIRRTDFLSLDQARREGLEVGRPVKKKESTLREETRDWQTREKIKTGPATTHAVIHKRM
jgi:hypothetical protein